MLTRSELSNLKPDLAAGKTSRRRGCGDATAASQRKRPRLPEESFDSFDGLPDDLVLLILSRISAAAGAPADLISVLLTCRRLNGLGMHPMVLSKLSTKGTGLNAKSWSESANRFLKRCADAGSLEASYTLGMIRFYCLENRGSGTSLMAKAAMGSHAAALYSLAVIQFNGSGGSKNDKDLSAGVALCARAAYAGHIDALRELGHCLQDGYGVKQNVAEGRRFLLQANARELAGVLSAASSEPKQAALKTAAVMAMRLPVVGRWAPAAFWSLLSDFGCAAPAPAPEAHPANRFMVEWFEERREYGAGWRKGVELRMCSYGSCGRPETRPHEFRRCSVCGTVNYCSRACQALHWKLVHKAECTAMDRWLHGGAAGVDGRNGGGPLPAGDEGWEVI